MGFSEGMPTEDFEETTEDTNIESTPKPSEIIQEASNPLHVAQTRYPEQWQDVKQKRAEESKKFTPILEERLDQQKKIQTEKPIIEQKILQTEIERKTTKEHEEKEKDKWIRNRKTKSKTRRQVDLERENLRKENKLKRKTAKIDRNLKNIEERRKEIEEKHREINERLQQINTAQNKLKYEAENQEELQPIKKRLSEFLPLLKTDVLTPEEKEIVFTEEYLSSLSMEEYLKVWRLGSPNFLAHVSRHGIRDHADMKEFHSTGLGEFHNSFQEMLRDSKSLRPALSRLAINIFDPDLEKEDVRKYVESVRSSINTHPEPVIESIASDSLDMENLSPSEATSILTEENLRKLFLEKLSQKSWQERELEHLEETIIADHLSGEHLDSRKPSSFLSDSTAIHLSSEDILDGNYGAEEGNEVFVVFPTDMVASQYQFAQNRLYNDITKAPETSSDLNRNDIFVWNRNQAIPLDAGIVFLPANTPVNPKNGSKYENLTDTDGEVVLAKETVTSQEYWEEYFRQNPEHRPAHIHYYDSQEFTPTTAVQSFLRENGIVKIKDQDRNLGFDKNYVGLEPMADGTLDQDSIRSVQRVRELAKEVLEEQKRTPITGVSDEKFEYLFQIYQEAIRKIAKK